MAERPTTGRRKEFELTNEQLHALLGACKPMPCMMIGEYITGSPQESANDAWARLGWELGFHPMTVRPVPGKGNRFFTAEPQP